MAFCKLSNYHGQVFKDMNLSAPAGAFVFDAETHEPIEIKEKTKFYTIGNMRLGIGKYRINMTDPLGKKVYCNNYMMSGNNKLHHALWTLEDKPYTAQDIFDKYGYKVTDNHERIKKHKLTGRVRALRTIKILKSQNRLEEAERIEKELKEHLALGKRYICPIWFDFKSEEQKKSMH
jgi:hypothetical protein